MLTLTRCPFHPVLPQRHVKDLVILPKARVAGYTKTRICSWSNEVEVDWLCSPGIVWEPLREKRFHTQLVRNTWLQSSQLAGPLLTDLFLIKVELVCASWSPFKNKNKTKNKCRRGINGQTFPPNPRKRRNSHHNSVNVTGIQGKQLFFAFSLSYNYSMTHNHTSFLLR